MRGRDADLAMACKLAVDSKVDYPAACNALETLLVHEKHLAAETPGEASAWTSTILPALKAAKIELFAGKRAEASGLGFPPCPALRHEYGAVAMTVEVVSDLDAAVEYIHANGSSHTDCIITDNQATADAFLRRVDSACVFHNASTRFSDGFMGLGAEVGISTSRIHARAPRASRASTTRWLLRGKGQFVEKDTGVEYTHKDTCRAGVGGAPRRLRRRRRGYRQRLNLVFMLYKWRNRK